MRNMKRRFGVLEVSVILVVLAAGYPSVGSAQGSDSAQVGRVIARYVQAIGGEKALASVQMLRTRVLTESPMSAPMETHTFSENNGPFMREQSDVAGTLHATTAGARFVGDSAFGNAKTVAIEVTGPGTVTTKHFDRTSGLLIGMEMLVPSPDGAGQVKGSATYSDYREFGGVKVATVATMKLGEMAMTLRTVEWTPGAFDPSVFALPEAVKALAGRAP